MSSAVARHVVVTRADERAGTHLLGALRELGLDATTVPGERLGSPGVVQDLAGAAAVVHLALELELERLLRGSAAARRTRLLHELRTILTAAAAAGVPRVVVVTSAAVHGARPDNPVPLPEDTERRSPDVEGVVADLLALEAETAALAPALPGTRVTVMRPAALVGPGVDTAVTRHFEAPRLLVQRGTVPAWQFCHLDDLAGAVATVLDHDELPPALAVGAPGHLSQDTLERLGDLRHVELSPAAAHGAAERLHRLGVVPLPPTDLAYVAHPWAVQPTALLAAGWRPRHDNAACLEVLLGQARGQRAVLARRLRSRDAAVGAVGAASAAVALAATAAVVRRRRRD